MGKFKFQFPVYTDDPKTAEEEENELIREHRKEIVKTLKFDNRGRRSYAWGAFWVVVLWLGFVLYLLFQVAGGKLSLSDSVLITLLTTTTANVLGLWGIVANYLFKRNDDSPTNSLIKKIERGE